MVKDVIKMRICFEGIASNAMRGIRELEDLAKQHEDYDEYNNSAFAAESCISAYRDTILALCKGDADLETVKDFWFHGEDVSVIPYDCKVLKFTEKQS